MGVLDGQPVSAGVTNPAFINKNVDDTTPSNLGLGSSNPLYGPMITSAQREHNAHASFIGLAINQVYNYLPTWAQNFVGAVNDTVFARVSALVALFSGSIGHTHDGTDGNGPQVASAAIANSPPTPANVSNVNTIGSSTAFAKGDHAHQGVHSIDGSGGPLYGDVILSGGTNVSLSQSGQTVTINSSGGGTASAVWAPADVAATGNIPLTGLEPLYIDGVLMGGTSVAEIPLSLASAGQQITFPGSQKFTHRFISAVNTQLSTVDLKLRLAGTPSGNMFVTIVGDLNGAPDLSTVLDTSANVAVASVPGSFSAVTFSGLTMTLTAATPYWIVIQGDATYNAGYPSGVVSIATISSTTYAPFGSYQYYDGSSWFIPGNSFGFVINAGLVATITRSLLTAQTMGADNGLYDYAAVSGSYTLTRSADAASSVDFKSGKIVVSSYGSFYWNSEWELGTPNAITVGTSSLQFLPVVVGNTIAFNVAGGTTAFSSATDLIFLSLIDDSFRSFDLSTGEFVIVVPGRYVIDCNLTFTGTSTTASQSGAQIVQNGVVQAVGYYKHQNGLTGEIYSIRVTRILRCTVGDRIKMQGISGNSMTMYNDPTLTYFEGHRIGN